MSVSQRVFKNTSFLFIAESASRLVSAILSIVVARELGATQLGQYAYVISIITIANVFSEFGLTSYLIKHQATLDESGRRKLAAQVTFLRIVIALAVFSVVVVYGLTAVSDDYSRTLLLIASLGLFTSIYSSICIGELRVREMMSYEAFARFGGAVVTTIAGLSLLWMGYGVLGLVILTVVVQLATSIYFLVVAWKKDLNRSVQASTPTQTKQIFKGVLPFALVSLLVTIYFRIDAIMIQHILGPAELGYYAAVYKIMELLLTIPVLLSVTLFPALAKHLHHDPQLVLRSAAQAIKFLSIVALPLVAGGVILAPVGIVTLYSPSYTASIPVFQILIFTLIPVFISAVTSTIISAGEKPIINTYIAAGMVCLNIGLNFWLIPIFGIAGAALATVATEAVGMLIGLVCIRRGVGRLAFWTSLIKPILASICMVLVIRVYPTLWLMPVYGAVYFIVLFLLRPFGPDDKMLALKLAPKKFHQAVEALL